METETKKKSICVLSGAALHILAIVFMLMDHMWATVVPGNQWMTYVGRLAFPIFAFLISEGYVHTSNFKKYALRLLLFGIISEIPFDLMCESTIFYPFHQNVMFTLLLGLISIRALDEIKKERSVDAAMRGVLVASACCFIGAVCFVDYGWRGVLTVIIFYVFRSVPYAKVWQFVSLTLLFEVFYRGMYIPIELFGHTFEFYTQGFCILSLIPIWLYNGERGCSSKGFKCFLYAFYPVHMLALYLIFAYCH